MAANHHALQATARRFCITSVSALIAAVGFAAAGSIDAAAREITAAVNANFSSLDSWDALDNLSRAASASIYEGLYRFDRNMKPVPQLAESYEVSPDGLTYPSSSAPASSTTTARTSPPNR